MNFYDTTLSISDSGGRVRLPCSSENRTEPPVNGSTGVSPSQFRRIPAAISLNDKVVLSNMKTGRIKKLESPQWLLLHGFRQGSRQELQIKRIWKLKIPICQGDHLNAVDMKHLLYPSEMAGADEVPDPLIVD